jgi:hypothetical protein
MSDLWPKDIGHANMRAPVTILREQALLLGDKTQNLVKADVDTLSPSLVDRMGSPYQYYGQPESVFVHNFYLVAPALDNYRYKLFDIAHPVDLYPVDFHLDEDIQEELLSQNGKGTLSAQTEDEFIDILGKILNSRKAKHVVHALLAQLPRFEPAKAL